MKNHNVSIMGFLLLSPIFFEGGGKILPYTATALIFIAIGMSVYKSLKTGSYRQANTTGQMRKKISEEIAISNRYDIFTKYSNPSYQKEMEAHREKWAEPGSKAFKEIQKKEAEWKSKYGY